MHGATRVLGTAGDDFLEATRGGVIAYGGNDTIHATAMAGYSQIHTYGGDGDDYTILDFSPLSSFSHGHHVRGAAGADTFEFRSLSNVQGTVVGRIEDFDASSDTILIEGVEVDFNNLPKNVRLVEYAGALGPDVATAQQWLLIDTGLGHIFYALEGARQDMSDPIAQEGHFLMEAPDFDDLVDVSFVDPVNYIPEGFTADGGIVIEDTDVVRDDVFEVIEGTERGDLISAGLNDDTVFAHDGNDMVWGGSGNDALSGGQGLDTIHGGNGNDRIDGGGFGDEIYGDAGNDLIIGDWGWDYLDGGSGNDILDGGSGRDTLIGGAGDDLLEGGWDNDIINGGAGRDLMAGGTGADTFVFSDFDWGFDVVGDFEVGTDRLRFGGEVDGMEHIVFVDYVLDGQTSTLLRFRDEDGAVDRTMGGVVVWGVSSDELSADDFLF